MCFAAVPCMTCDHVLEDSQGTYTIVDNEDLLLSPGSVICWEAKTYTTGFRFQNFHGTAGNRFIFTNCGGTAILNTNQHAINTIACNYIRITGDYEGLSDDENLYGRVYELRITKSTKGLALEGATTQAEVDHVEITNTQGHAAIIAKSDPNPSDGCSYCRNNFVMEDVLLHHNYVHDVEKEGFYVGYFNCDGQPNAHFITGLRLYENIVESSTWDGIQVGCANSDGRVYNNYVQNYGTKKATNQQSGFAVNSGTKADFYGNYVNGGSGIGILYQGNGDSSIYNNVVLNAGTGGIVAQRDDPYTDDAYVAIHHNTVVNPGGIGISATIGGSSTNNIYRNNNVIVGAQPCANGASFPDDNVCADSTAGLGFTNPKNNDYSLLESSSLINAGVGSVTPAVNTDFNGEARSGTPDVGAYEFDTAMRMLPDPVDVSSATKSVHLPLWFYIC